MVSQEFCSLGMGAFFKGAKLGTQGYVLALAETQRTGKGPEDAQGQGIGQ